MTTGGHAVGHDLDGENPFNVSDNKETEDNGPLNVLGRDEKTADKLENAERDDGKTSQNRIAGADISKQMVVTKSINDGGSVEERDIKPDDAKAGNDNADDENRDSTQGRTSRIRTVVNRVRLSINFLSVTY